MENKTEIVKMALDLSIKLNNNINERNTIASQKFKATPPPPTHATVQKPSYPKIVSTVKFDWTKGFVPSVVLAAVGFGLMEIGFGIGSIFAMLALFISPLLILGAPVYMAYYYFKVHRKLKAADIERIRTSSEYINQCAKIDSDFIEHQKALDQEYEAQMKMYKEVTLPTYQNELQEWTKRHDAELKRAQTNVNTVDAELSKLYSTTKIVPLQYRKIHILRYIYDVMSTSDYDVQAAIESYDRNEQRKLDEARLREQRIANQQMADQNYLLDAQNGLINEQNEISEKSRRDAKIAATIATVQRHNTNKYLKRK